jgi:hypothetical protein
MKKFKFLFEIFQFFSTGYKPYQQIEDFDTTLLSC